MGANLPAIYTLSRKVEQTYRKTHRVKPLSNSWMTTGQRKTELIMRQESVYVPAQRLLKHTTSAVPYSCFDYLKPLVQAVDEPQNSERHKPFQEAYTLLHTEAPAH